MGVMADPCDVNAVFQDYGGTVKLVQRKVYIMTSRGKWVNHLNDDINIKICL